jgi:hypothetical protein
MSCCGNKRQEIRQRRIVPITPRPAATLSMQPRTPVVFQGAGSYLVTGEHSRHVYHFFSDQPEQWIDSRDVAGLLRTGFFQCNDPKSRTASGGAIFDEA